MHKLTRIIVGVGCGFVLGMTGRVVWAETGPRSLQSQGIGARLSGGLKIVAVSSQEPVERAETPLVAAAESFAFPEPPLAGFSPLVAMTTSDEQSTEDLDYEHDLQWAYAGSALNPPATENVVVGILDSGSVVDLVAGSSAVTLGLTGSNLTGSEFPIGGVGGSVNADLSYPIGFFAAGLGAIQANGELDLTQVVGHSNVSVVVAPEISCGSESVTAIIGTPFISFFTTVIRVDMPRHVTVDGESLTSPDVQILSPFDPTIPTLPRSIALEFGGLSPVTTASYYPDLYDLETPIFPTLLSLSPLSIPFGGAFFTTIGVLQGEPGPLNPIQNMRVMVDTGAQSSIMSPAMAANLSLPTTPDFTVDVCGVGGLVTDVPGYYIDYVKISALGGALEFARAPFVVLDLESPEGGSLDGVLGMNFFWNRNLVFEPSLTASGFLHVSDPLSFAFGDFDRDFDVDDIDVDFFIACSSGPSVPISDPNCTQADADQDRDIDMEDFGVLQICLSGTDVVADPNCGP